MIGQKNNFEKQTKYAVLHNVDINMINPQPNLIVHIYFYIGHDGHISTKSCW